MKKLMIAVAIVCAAAFAQAAAIDWTFSEAAFDNPAAGATLYKDPVNLTGMGLYVFTATEWAALADKDGKYASTALASAIDNKTIGDADHGGSGNYTTSTWKSNGTVKSGDITKDASYALVYVITDGENYQAMNGAQAAIGYDPEAPGSVTPGSLAIASNKTPFTNAGMQTFTDVVPEPTSGLLLLLGVAGLALKRKRA